MLSKKTHYGILNLLSQASIALISLIKFTVVSKLEINWTFDRSDQNGYPFLFSKTAILFPSFLIILGLYVLIMLYVLYYVLYTVYCSDILAMQSSLYSETYIHTNILLL